MLLAQDGHGGAGVLEAGLKENVIDGMVLNPVCIEANKLKANIKSYLEQYKNKLILFDPHFYVGYMPQADKIGKLKTYTYYKDGLSRTSFTSSTIPDYVKDVLKFQLSLNIKYIMSPALIVEGLNDASSQITLQLHLETERYNKIIKARGIKLLHSLPISESCLKEGEQFQSFLDDITLRNSDGFYVFVERLESGTPQWSDPIALARFMYLVYVLAGAGFEVFCGYVDLVGILLAAVGAKAISNGWWQTQRQFTNYQFIKRGGRQARPRYTSASLLNSIYQDPDVYTLPETGYISQVVEGIKYDTELKKDPLNAPWPNLNSRLHYWKTIKNIIDNLDEKEDIDKKLSMLNSRIDRAMMLYGEIESKGQSFSTASGPAHLPVWKRAITTFNDLRKER